MDDLFQIIFGILLRLGLIALCIYMVIVVFAG